MAARCSIHPVGKNQTSEDMEEPPPRVKRKITPTSLYSIPSELEESVRSKPMGGLLADVTSLILLSAASADHFMQEKEKCILPSAVGDDQSNQLLQAVSAAINDLLPQILRDEGSTSVLKESEETTMESEDAPETVRGIHYETFVKAENEDAPQTVQGSQNKTFVKASCFPPKGSTSILKESEETMTENEDKGRQDKTFVVPSRFPRKELVTSEVHRSFDDPLNIAHSTISSQHSLDDTVSLQSSGADSILTDRPLNKTYDSGIASPATFGFTGKSEKYHPLLSEDVNITSDLTQHLQYLRMCVEQKLHDSMTGIAPCTLDSKGVSLSEEIAKLLGKVGDHYKGSHTEASLPASHSSVQPGSLSTQDLYVDRALSSSLLVYENTKLSAEVAYLQKKVEILEQITGTQGFTVDTPKPTMETISIGSQTDLRFNQSMSTLDETDFGLSDISVTNETNCLMGTVLENEDLSSPSGMSTPGGVPTKQTRRRKIEVPSHLKASTSYLSINPWAEMDDKQQSGSSAGCWRGLCACFDRGTPARLN